VNREIKFRAWARSFTTGQETWLIVEPLKQYPAWNIISDLYEYIGLKDEYGTDIYEGDILRTDDFYNNEIIFDGGGFNISGGDSGLNLEYQLKEHHYSYKVIGNIYENPELLNQPQEG